MAMSICPTWGIRYPTRTRPPLLSMGPPPLLGLLFRTKPHHFLQLPPPLHFVSNYLHPHPLNIERPPVIFYFGYAGVLFCYTFKTRPNS